MESGNPPVEPSREQVDAMPAAVVLEFGASWCGYCRAAQPLLATAFAARPAVRHLRIEDGPGRALGRSFRVKLWPTLVFLVDGRELARVVRPGSAQELEDAFAAVATGAARDPA